MAKVEVKTTNINEKRLKLFELLSLLRGYNNITLSLCTLPLSDSISEIRGKAEQVRGDISKLIKDDDRLLDCLITLATLTVDDDMKMMIDHASHKIANTQ